ncbi:MAG: hypothetical protein E6I73_15760 [Chloroflexi bacterium]|nr:MAG: hypothetical protein E6I73_15760 [Chloroflexota bacterium]
MQLLKRLPVAVPIVLIAQLAFAGTSSAFIPGNTLLPAGNYHITTRSADYFVCCTATVSNLSVTVTDTTTVAKPAVGPSTTTRETDVEVDTCDSNFVCGSACFIAAGPSDFTISGLSSALLNTAFDPATSQPCPDRPISGLPAFTLNVSWSGISPVGTTTKTSIYSCAGYNAEVHTLNSNANATDSAVTSLFGSSSIPGESGNLGSNDQRWHAQGVALDTCSPQGLGGGGKGAGPGPTGSGGFEIAEQIAAANFPGGFVSLATVTKLNRPTGTPPTTFKETELTVASFFGFPSFFLCFALQSPNTFTFGSGLSSASVHAVIDQTTPACAGFSNGPFTSFTADLTWTATGPLASIQNTAISDCGSFHQVLLSTDSTNPASASGNVSLIGDISSPQSSINSSDRRFQDTGTAPQGCILRP